MPVLSKKIQSLYKQLFGSILSTLLTLLSLYLIANTLPNILNWVLINATWFGDSAEDCGKQGACWLYIATWWKQFIYGSYPDSEIWRINLCCMMLVVLISVMLLDKVFSPSVRKNVLFITLLVFPLAAGFLMYGGVMGLTVVETRYWGGLSLTLVIAIFGIISSFPVGVLLAMGADVKNACNTVFLYRFYRVVARCAFNHGTVYGLSHVSAIYARGNKC